MPFNGSDKEDKSSFYNCILKGKYDFPKEDWKRVSKDGEFIKDGAIHYFS